MPPRSLRTGTRTPNPGAVLKGCPRPKALRFGSPFHNGPSAFGDGTYSGNIMQGGVVLQPQDYLLDGVTPLRECIVITGAATVAPDATTGAAAFMAHNLALVGATASLSASTNCKGLLGFVNGRVAQRGGAHLHMDKLGKAGNFGDLSPDMLLPAALARRIATRKLKAYVVKGTGAHGVTPTGSYTTSGGLPGLAAGQMQTGGGGSGCWNYGTAGASGCGGPCCGGAGSGGDHYGPGAAAGDFGGPGANSHPGDGAYSAGGGAGDPVGSGNGGSGPACSPGQGAGGGLLGLFAARLDIVSGCIVSSDGAPGGTGSLGGGSAGGGCLLIVTKPGGYTNSGTVRAAGGASICSGGPGGAGSVNIFELAA